jgi:hypothetical protein
MTLKKCERRGGGRIYIFICVPPRARNETALAHVGETKHTHTLVAFDREKERDAHRILRMHIHSGRFVQISMRPTARVCVVYTVI